MYLAASDSRKALPQKTALDILTMPLNLRRLDRILPFGPEHDRVVEIEDNLLCELPQ